jgi:hypothetical protein
MRNRVEVEGRKGQGWRGAVVAQERCRRERERWAGRRLIR